MIDTQNFNVKMKIKRIFLASKILKLFLNNFKILKLKTKVTLKIKKKNYF